MDLGLEQDIEFYSQGNEKKVVLPFNRLKNWIKLSCIIVIVFLSILIIGVYLLKPSEQTISYTFWIYFMPFCFIVMFGSYWFLIKPTKIIISNKSGSINIIKIDLFYKTTKINIEKSKHPYIILRPKNIIGFTIYIGKVYDLIFGWEENKKSKEIRLRPTIFTGATRPPSLKKFSKSDLEKIANHLSLSIQEEKL